MGAKVTPFGIGAAVNVLLSIEIAKAGVVLPLLRTKKTCLSATLIRAKAATFNRLGVLPLLALCLNRLFATFATAKASRVGAPLGLAVPRPRAATRRAVFLATVKVPMATIGGLPIGTKAMPFGVAARLLLGLCRARAKVVGALSLPRWKITSLPPTLSRSKAAMPVMAVKPKKALFVIPDIAHISRVGPVALLLAVPKPVDASIRPRFLATAKVPAVTMGSLPMGANNIAVVCLVAPGLAGL